MLTTLDPKTALVVIDLQKGLMALPVVHPIGGIVANARALASAFRRHGLPVVLVNVAGLPPGRTDQGAMRIDMPPDFAELIPELNRQPDDILITKRAPGPFSNTALEAELKVRDVTTIVISGVSTSAGVEMTARHAYDLGFNVVLAVDAMTDRSEEAHTYSVTRVFPRIGETGSTRDIIGKLNEI